MTAPTRVLSLIQPWAHCLIWLGKDAENRDWQYPPPREHVGRRIAIHASKKSPDFDTVQELAGEGFYLPHDLPLGAIVGSARLRGWVRIMDADLNAPRVLEHSDTLTREEAERLACSRWAMGPMILAFDQRLGYAETIPARGMLGFWTPTEDDQRRIEIREAEARAGGFDPEPHREPDQDDELGLGARRDPRNPKCRCSELMRCDSCVALEEGRRKGAADRSRARAMFEAAGKPVPSWAREP